jgi:hypothetical protein
MRARVSEARGRWFDSSRSLQIFDIRGLGKRINPLGLGPRESRFKSEVPDQFLWGSQVARQLAVNRLMRRFESCPHSQKHRGRLLVEGPSPTKRCSRVRSSTPVPILRVGFGRLEAVLIRQFRLVQLQRRAPIARKCQAPVSVQSSKLVNCNGTMRVRIAPGAPYFARSFNGRT